MEVKDAIWHQFGAAIDALDDAMAACPDALWSDPEKNFWYGAYHALFFCDLDLSGGVEGFAPPRVYTKDELRGYARYCKAKLREVVNMLTDDDARVMHRLASTEVTRVETFLYSMRHVQHHAAQLNLLLRQAGTQPPRYVKSARES